LIITYEIWSGNPPVLADLSSIPLSGFILPVTSLFVLAVIISVISGTVSGTFFQQIRFKNKFCQVLCIFTFLAEPDNYHFTNAASIVLIICITGIFKQLNYLASYNTGLDTKNIVIVNNGNRIGDHFTSLKTELKNLRWWKMYHIPTLIRLTGCLPIVTHVQIPRIKHHILFNISESIQVFKKYSGLNRLKEDGSQELLSTTVMQLFQ